jgi:hypothetical protein
MVLLVIYFPKLHEEQGQRYFGDVEAILRWCWAGGCVQSEHQLMFPQITTTILGSCDSWELLAMLLRNLLVDFFIAYAHTSGLFFVKKQCPLVSAMIFSMTKTTKTSRSWTTLDPTWMLTTLPRRPLARPFARRLLNIHGAHQLSLAAQVYHILPTF